jgi:hypothetical protein
MSRDLTFAYALAFMVPATGCGGQIVGSDGGAMDGPSSGDAVVAASGEGISCGAATCKAGAETCCVKTASRACMTTSSGTCSGQAFRIACDDTADCGSSICCFSNVLSSVQVATMCMPDCSQGGTVQVCRRDGDCRNHGPCVTYTCGGSFGPGSITLGLCATTAPGFCT